MARPKRQRGTVTRVRSDNQWKWLGRWNQYVKSVDGRELRRPRKRLIGLCDEMTKTAARDALLKIIADDQAAAGLMVAPEPKILTMDGLCGAFLRARMATWEKTTQRTNKSLVGAISQRFGTAPAVDVTKQTLQEWLNDLAAGGKSKSYLGQIILHLRTMFAEAVEENQLPHDPAKRLTRPKTRRASERHLTLAECERLLAACDGRDHLILRLFLVCGLRPGELFALRVNDVEASLVPGEAGRLRIDETLYESQSRDRAKTEGSLGWVVCPGGLLEEVQSWISSRGIADYPGELLFVSRRGCAIHAGNFLKRDLQTIAELAKIEGLNHQVLRRTTATHFQKHGTVKDAQGHLRHTNPETTLRFYQKTIPESLRAAASSWDRELTGTGNGPVRAN